MPDRDQPDALTFAQLLLNLLEEGRRTATYKLAVLLALIDCCAGGTDAGGTAPDVVVPPHGDGSASGSTSCAWRTTSDQERSLARSSLMTTSTRSGRQ